LRANLANMAADLELRLLLIDRLCREHQDPVVPLHRRWVPEHEECLEIFFALRCRVVRQCQHESDIEGHWVLVLRETAMIRAILVPVFAKELLLDFDTAALDQHQLITLTGLARSADVDLAGRVDGVLVAGRSELHSDIIWGNVLVALIARAEDQTAECHQ